MVINDYIPNPVPMQLVLLLHHGGNPEALRLLKQNAFRPQTRRRQRLRQGQNQLFSIFITGKIRDESLMERSRTMGQTSSAVRTGSYGRQQLPE
jgi:hypothetical protein